MRPCKKCGQYRDTIRGVCGYCSDKKTVRDRRKRITVILVVLIIGSIGGIYGYQTFLASEIAKQMMDEAEEKLTQAKDAIKDQFVKIPQVVGHVKIPEISLPKIEPTPTLTLDELKQIALDDINKYRTENGLR